MWQMDPCLRASSDTIRSESMSITQRKPKELLAAAKFPMDTKISMITPTGRYTFDKQVAEAIQAYLIDIGLQVELRTYDWPTYMAMCQSQWNKTKFSCSWWAGARVPRCRLHAHGMFHSSSWPPKGMAVRFTRIRRWIS